MTRPLAAIVATAVGAVVCLPGPADSHGAAIASQVRQVLQNQTSVEVVVALRAPRRVVGSPRAAALASLRDKVLAAMPEGGFDLIRGWSAVPGMVGNVTAEGLSTLASHADVLAVSLHGYGTAHLGDSVPLIGASTVHSGGNTAAGTEAAVIDSGARSTHLDLAGDLVAGQCFCTSSGSCCPNGSGSQSGLAAIAETTGHGTNVASIITSDGVAASVGVAPDADVSVVRIFNSSGFFSFTDLISALDWIINNRLSSVDVINMSIGSFALHSGICDQDGGPFAAEYLLIASAIDTLREAGVLAVASAGNNGAVTSMSMPACLRNTVAVGASYDSNIGSYSWTGVCTDATTAADQYACWSNISSHTDIAGPGCKTTAAWYQGDNQIGWWCGTSQAAPHVVATALLIKAASPFQQAYHFEHCLRNSPSSVTSAGTTIPLLDADHAVTTCHFNAISQLFDLKKLVAAYKKAASAGDDKLVIKGRITPFAAFDPLSQALTFAFSDVDGEAISVTIPAGAGAWSSKKVGKYVYKDKRGAERGVTKALLKAVAGGAYKVAVKVADTNLSRADSTSGVVVEVLAGSNMHTAMPTSCQLKPAKKLVCK